MESRTSERSKTTKGSGNRIKPHGEAGGRSKKGEHEDNDDLRRAKNDHRDTVMDCSVPDSGRKPPHRKPKVDLRSRSEVGGVPNLGEPLLPESDLLQLLKEQLSDELNRLGNYFVKSARKRVKEVKSGDLIQIQRAVGAEIAVSVGSTRLDLVANLLGRLARIEALKEQIEEEEKIDYGRRFGPTP
jgi:hypothetical protein